MLRLVNVKKDYTPGSGVVHALKGIDLAFRKSEFVCILGPSGCGKTTMLNIIGGLDKYTDGDLIINGRSTKSYKDRDWDTYRNHSIGFVFQSYNLIPHQTVLGNVELALTLSGVSRAERKRRAKKALEQVGLGDQLNKNPSQLSGGQMQRVAIARALVNDPDIVLADEPTGALDTETSVQIMELLKEISKDRLIIMVTHNPDLAGKYATRIINMLDGEITGDSCPPGEDELVEKGSDDGKKKPSMSFFTAFSLSLRNLFTKKGRTILTSFAGSIGIIGIALIYAVSHGMTNYINEVQEDTLASYPITIQETHVDLSELLQTVMGSANSDYKHENDAVYQKSAVYDLINSLSKVEASKNDLRKFKEYVENAKDDAEDKTGLREALSGVQYSFDLDLKVYTESVDGKIIRSDSNELLRSMMREMRGVSAETDTENRRQSFGGSSGGIMSLMNNNSANYSMWREMLPGDGEELISPLVKKQYQLVGNSVWPQSYDEIVLIMDENNELDDMTLYALGLVSKEEIDKIMIASLNGEAINFERKSWSYDEILGMDFRVILNSDIYASDESGSLYIDLTKTDAGLRYLYDNALKLKVVGVIKPNEDAISAMLQGAAIGYTHGLTEYVIDQASSSPVVKAQNATPNLDILTGLPFKESTGTLTEQQKQEEFIKYVEKIGVEAKADKYIKIKSIAPEDYLNEQTETRLAAFTPEQMREMLLSTLVQQMGMNEETVKEYAASMTDESIKALFRESIREQIKAAYASQVAESLASTPSEQLAAALDNEYKTYTASECAVYYDEALEFSSSTYEDNMKKFGSFDKNSPSAIYLYASSFASKDVINDAIDAYNKGLDDLDKIKYTDYIGIILSSVTQIINAITYVLIAFVAISLVVSSIMIGVITLISVQERTKEIGILRSIGASKRDVSSMFNAETLIIGFTSGAFGVVITYLLCLVINLILHSLTGIDNLNAFLPVSSAVILILISMGLTLFSGIIPSRSAAKKDPVIALRTE